MSPVVVSGAFDDIRSKQIRFLHEASKLGPLYVSLWSDAAVEKATGKPPQFPLKERQYFLDAIRYVKGFGVSPDDVDGDSLPKIESIEPAVWVVDEATDGAGKRAAAKKGNVDYRVLTQGTLAGFPAESYADEGTQSGRKKVVVTGCFDWFHTGHVRFTEEVSKLGDLYVVVGHDDNIRLLKGEGHPLFPADERRYVVGSVKYVKQALVSTGDGWMDAEPEFVRIKPDIYAVNEDGDRPEKKAFCEKYGIEYKVLKRTPKEGLTRRSSTDLRGF